MAFNRVDLTEWLASADEPWVRYRALTDLTGLPEDSAQARSAYAALVSEPRVQAVIRDLRAWPGPAIKRHNDARLLLHQLAVLAEIGIRADGPGVREVVETILSMQAEEGAFTSLIVMPRAFGGNGQETLSWMLCDAPTLLYALLQLGYSQHPAVQRGVDHLANLAVERGWPCASGCELGAIRGPGRKDDPCPYATLIAIKALCCLPSFRDHAVVRQGAEFLLWHWAHRGERKVRMFGVGTEYRKLKYPFVWYDILHVVDTLSRLPWARSDPRLREMVEVIAGKADESDRFRAESVWLVWKQWDFGQKREPSPWITLLVQRILLRMSDKRTLLAQQAPPVWGTHDHNLRS